MSNPIFGKKQVADATEKAEKRAKLKEQLKPGVYLATITSMELKQTKKKDPMIVIEFEVDDEHSPILEHIAFTDRSAKYSVVTVVELFFRGFKFNIKPVEEEDMHDAVTAVFNQIKRFKKKELKIAVKHEEEVYLITPEDGGEPKVKEGFKARYWYAGHKDEDLTFSEKGSVKKLSGADKAKLINEQKGRLGDETLDTSEGVDVSAELEDDVPDWVKETDQSDTKEENE